MKILYDLFLSDSDCINEIMSEDSDTIRINNVDAEDVCTICRLGIKYDFTVAAFLTVSED